MPPGVSGLLESGSGASRVHTTNPSDRGAPAATPRLKGSPARQLCAAAWRSKLGAAINAKPAPAALLRTRRRVGRLGGNPLDIVALGTRLEQINILAH